MYDFKIAAEASDYLKISKAFAIHSNHVSPQIYIIKWLSAISYKFHKHQATTQNFAKLLKRLQPQRDVLQYVMASSEIVKNLPSRLFSIGGLRN